MPLLDAVPDAPEWLPNIHAVVEWERLAPLLLRLNLLSAGNIGPLGNLCALHGVMVQQWSAGLVPTASVIQQYRALVNEFGLTPASAAKVRADSPNEKTGNPFAKFGPGR